MQEEEEEEKENHFLLKYNKFKFYVNAWELLKVFYTANKSPWRHVNLHSVHSILQGMHTDENQTCPNV